MYHVHGFKKLLTVTLLGLSAMACSSPEQDAEVREEPAQPTDAQDIVERGAVENTTDGDHADAHTSDSHSTDSHTIDSQMTETDHIDNGSNTELSDSINNEAEESKTIDINNEQIGTHDNKDIADGTDIEEHVSTY